MRQFFTWTGSMVVLSFAAICWVRWRRDEGGRRTGVLMVSAGFAFLGGGMVLDNLDVGWWVLPYAVGSVLLLVGAWLSLRQRTDVA